MHLPLSSEQAATLVVLDEVGSTNDELVRRAAAGSEPEFSVLATTSQTGGRGRLGRVWIAPPGKTLAVSVLLRPAAAAGTALGIDYFGWLPLLAGIAMTRSVAEQLPGRRVSLKWPNDVQVDGAKIAGILAELLPGADAVVIGVGVNLAFGAEELPTPTSTSLLLAGADKSGDELADAVLASFLRELRALYRALVAGASGAAGTAPDVAAVRDALLAVCSTIGQRVKVSLPGGGLLFGTATGVDDAGRLLLSDASDRVEGVDAPDSASGAAARGSLRVVAAGDITHLRYE
jgi:BirA family biotin operon repressor/biotin-[acetyl-CoA-carboxylase] ligase